MRVMGIDPGLTRCGIGIIEGQPGNKGRLIAVGVIRTSADDETPQRLRKLDDELDHYLDTYRPDAVAVERVFSQHNLASVIPTAQAAGIALVHGAKRDLPTHSYTPSEAKAAVCGNGGADKRQVTTMVTRILRLESPPKPADAADALALALCHLWRGALKSRLNQAGRQQVEAKRKAALERYRNQRSSR
ncbi:crossover junction endodeoxyribonuclease RuvC [Haloglycomyces albus]|uniref:crossover junction endodeoxyribonuclease RuvC n=1 Tax=Haloglycomyces albus TaxID=526067 RepID=UPI00046D933C|nr:crossover junction endodeoxyribonuclease RuvC [Haloglycomyces albus]